jgi:hypothetical protein
LSLTKIMIVVLVYLISGAVANAESCKKAADLDDANSAVCMLSVGGRTLIANERCRIGISPEGHLFMMDSGKYQARVEISGEDHKARMRWNGGALGVVNGDDGPTEESPMCFRNRRAAMCMSDFTSCN